MVQVNIAPGTVAAIAASLMAQGENLSDEGEIFSPHWSGQRKRRICMFVALAHEICIETERQVSSQPQPNRPRRITR